MSMVRPLHIDVPRLAASSASSVPHASALHSPTSGVAAALPGLRRGGLAVCVLATMVFAGVSMLPILPGETWRHLNLGRRIDTLGIAAGTTDSAAAVAWLADWIAARIVSLGGLDGLLVAHAGVAALSVLAAAWGLRRGGVRLTSATILVAGAALAAGPTWGVIRLQSVALPLAALLAAELKAPLGRRTAITLPALLVLWANLDVSFLFGLALIVSHAGGALVEWLSLRHASMQLHGRRCLRMSLLLPLCLAATLLNPLGARLWLAVSEGDLFWPLAIRSPSAALYGGLLLLAVGLHVRSRRRMTWRERFALVACTVSPLLHAAWLAPAAFAAVVLAGPRLLRRRRRHRSRAGQRGLAGRNLDTAQAPSFWRAGLATAMVAGVLVWMPASRALVLGEPRPEATITSATVPCHLARQLAVQQVTGSVFVPAEWGSYLAWKTNDRAGSLQPWPGPMSSAQTLADQRLLVAGGDAAWSVVDRVGLRWLVLNATRHATAFSYFSAHPRARVRYLDQQGALVELLPAGAGEARP